MKKNDLFIFTLLVFIFPIYSSGDETVDNDSKENSDCKPLCRKGYFCYKGECISACNPPCPEGYECDSEINDCVPISTNQQSLNQPTINTRNTNKIKIGNSFVSEEDAKNVGNVFFNITNVIYGIGTGVSSIAPLVMKEVYKNNDYNEYDYYDYRYNSNDAVENLGPIAFVFSISGGLNQVARHKQRIYLRALGEEPNGGLIAASWILYAASIHTANWNIYSQTRKGSDDLRTSSGIINMITLFSSYIVSNISYRRNKADLERAVNNKKKQLTNLESDKRSVEIFPYYSYRNKVNSVGLGISF